MQDLVRTYAQYTPLLSLALLIYFYIQAGTRQQSHKYRSRTALIVGTLLVGLVSFIAGFIVSADIYCAHAAHAECSLSGIFIGGPLSLTFFTVAYMVLWVRKW